MKINIGLSTSLTKTYTGKFSTKGVHFDQVDGLGNTPFSQDPLYFGFIAYMKTSEFLALAAEGTGIKDDDSTKWILQYITEGKSLSAPILYYDADDNAIDGHEGRHRCYAIMKYAADTTIPVVIKLRGEYRGRNVTRSLVEKFNACVKSQRGNVIKNTIEAYYSANDKFVRLRD